MSWYIQVLQKYFVFEGRARRKEYWMFNLFNAIVSIVLSLIDVLVLGIDGGLGILGGIYTLAVILPSLGVMARRLHDIGRSGWWTLIGLIPIIGGLILLYWTVLDSDAGDNAYGPSPKQFAI